MDYFDDKIFQQLISDTRFIRWAKGKDVPAAEKWENWKADHPGCDHDFDEAVKLVRDISFSSPAVSDREIHYLWDKVFSRMTNRTGSSNVLSLPAIFTKVAAILFIPLLAYTAWVYLDKGRLKAEYVQLAEERLNQNILVEAPVGTRTIVDLPDGSKAWLNAGSRLTYSALFSEEERRVTLKGEAFFKVQKSKIPFIVQNSGPEIKVYGTEFNVNAYDNEELVTVALAEGKISLRVDGKEHLLAPGQVSYFNKAQKTISVSNEDVDRFICWREGKYVFRDTPLNSILRQLQHQYGVEIHLTQPELGNYRYNATFQNENLDQIFELLELSAPIRYHYIKGDLKNDGTYSKGKVTIYQDKERIIKH